jgi:hypothetical protein
MISPVSLATPARAPLKSSPEVLLGVEKAPGKTGSMYTCEDISGSNAECRARVYRCITDERLYTTMRIESDTIRYAP